MVKRNKTRRSRSREQKEPIAPQGKWKSLLRKLWSPTGILLTSVSFFIAIVCAYFQFQAKLSLEPESPLKSDSAFNIPFRVTNESLLPVYNVEQFWAIEAYRGWSPSGDVFSDFERIDRGRDWDQPSPRIAILHSSQSTTLYPFDYVRTPEVKASRIELLVVITYQTAIFHWKRRQKFFFKGDVGADGGFHWYHHTPDEP